jgi:polyhydroxybutyrate depolymerase
MAVRGTRAAAGDPNDDLTVSVARPFRILFLSVLAIGGVISSVAAEPAQLVIAGRTRTFLLERPSAPGPRPTVIMLHGAGARSDAASIARATGLAQLATQQGMVAVFPQAIGRTVWNFFPPGTETERFLALSRDEGGIPDDIAFLNALVADLALRGISDPRRIFLAGNSNGGFMTLRMLCAGASFAAIGILISGMPEPVGADCRRARPTPTVMIKGTADSVVPYAGGLMGPGVGVWPNDRLVAFLRQLDQCKSPPKTSDIAGTLVEIEDSGNCAGGAVLLYRIFGGGHETPPLPNTAQLLVDFFRDKVRQ